MNVNFVWSQKNSFNQSFYLKVILKALHSVEVLKKFMAFNGHDMKKFPRQAQSEKCKATAKFDRKARLSVYLRTLT